MNDFDLKDFNSMKAMLARAVEEAVRFSKPSRLHAGTRVYGVTNDGKGDLLLTRDGQAISFPINPNVPHTEAVDQIMRLMM